MSFGNPAAERAALEQTYEDRTDVLRPGREVVYKITRKESEMVYSEIRSAL